jgi:hypothetical protein
MSARWLSDPGYMPCDACGVAVARNDRESHVCDRERLLDYQMFQLREEVAELDKQLTAYLASPEGRFELFYAARTRRGRD